MSTSSKARNPESAKKPTQRPPAPASERRPTSTRGRQLAQEISAQLASLRVNVIDAIARLGNPDFDDEEQRWILLDLAGALHDAGRVDELAARIHFLDYAEPPVSTMREAG